MIRYINIFGILMVFGNFLNELFKASEKPVIMIYSMNRVILLSILLILIVYFLISLKKRFLAELNATLFICLFSIVLTLEISMRLWVEKTPSQVVPYLSKDALAHYAAKTGNFSASSITGKGMRYYYQPNFKIENYPWVKIDADGYRNSVSVQPNSHVNTVFIGDSLTMAITSEADLADLYRKDYGSAYNLGMGGYSAAHYPLTFQEMVLDKNISFEHVVIGVCLENDLFGTHRFEEISARGDDYKAYLKASAPTSSGFSLWSVETAYNLIHLAKDRFIDRPDYYTNRVVFDLPHTSVSEPQSVLKFPSAQNAQEAGPLLQYLQQTADMAYDKGAKSVLFVLMPTSITLYSDFISDEKFQNDIQAYKQLADAEISLLKSELATETTLVVDVGPVLAKAAKTQVIASDSKIDYHLNTKGIEILFDYLRPYFDQY
ncbi:hypothetical protein RYZ26_09305 [Terasakiella sp. A23]|uniref:hypothetical protein n=1 Tax=Terasakiella sp. FCG-A23 TaxID=3080561 RepID=UPI0029538E10|nr:hypothetical protein [Terasakiella sp. A23]MDV7339788.1 hypothetical protein [Terasakiella sp. A23]